MKPLSAWAQLPSRKSAENVKLLTQLRHRDSLTLRQVLDVIDALLEDELTAYQRKSLMTERRVIIDRIKAEGRQYRLSHQAATMQRNRTESRRKALLEQALQHGELSFDERLNIQRMMDGM